MEREQSTTPNDDEEVLDAAIEFIRAGGPDADGCMVNIWQVFEELEGKFGDQFKLSPENEKLIVFVESVAADPRVEVLGWDGLEFAWNGDNNESSDESSLFF